MSERRRANDQHRDGEETPHAVGAGAPSDPGPVRGGPHADGPAPDGGATPGADPALPGSGDVLRAVADFVDDLVEDTGTDDTGTDNGSRA